MAELEYDLPHNLEVEQALLGALMLDNRCAAGIRDLVAGGDFYGAQNGLIFYAIMDEIAAGRTANPITLNDYFSQHIDEHEWQDAPYLARLLANAGVPASARDYAKHIRALSWRRDLIENCATVIEQAANPSIERPPEEIAARALKTWTDLETSAQSDRQSDSAALSERVVLALCEPVTHYSTGIGILDRAMAGGLIPGRSYGFIGRKKTGKTIFATTISENLDLAKVRHLFIAAEMGSEQITHRILARRMGVYSTDFYDVRRRQDPDFQESAKVAAARSTGSGIFIDTPGLTFESLRRHVTAAHLAGGIKGVILDYFQLVGGVERGDNMAQHGDKVAQWIADIARDLGLWFVVMAQENQNENVRGGEGMRLAFDQVYRLRSTADNGAGDAWLEMIDTRYTRWTDVGSESSPALLFNPCGPSFEPAA